MFVRILGSSPGESIVIVFDCGAAITIDCCKTGQVNHTISALIDLGIEPHRVLFNIITHFHDDHIRGISELIAFCSGAKIVIPDAWTEDVFKTFVATVSGDTTLGRPSVTKEIEKVFNALSGAKNRLFTVAELTSLYPPPAHQQAGHEALTILTPTFARKTKFLTSLATEIAAGDTQAFGFCEVNKNWTSICCLLRCHDKYLLLGGDVENLAPEFDLTAVHQSHLQPVTKYELVKLPHHGSETSFCPELRNLIENDHTVVAITPYPRGRKPLPTKDTADYLSGAKKIFVLAGKKVGASRTQRMRRKNFLLDPIPKYTPGRLDFLDGQVDMDACQSLDDYIAR